MLLMKVLPVWEPRDDPDIAMSRENLSAGIANKVDLNRLAQLQELGRGLKFWI